MYDMAQAEQGLTETAKVRWRAAVVYAYIFVRVHGKRKKMEKKEKETTLDFSDSYTYDVQTSARLVAWHFITSLETKSSATQLGQYTIIEMQSPDALIYPFTYSQIYSLEPAVIVGKTKVLNVH